MSRIKPALVSKRTTAAFRRCANAMTLASRGLAFDDHAPKEVDLARRAS